jgi:hypothetical protein
VSGVFGSAFGERSGVKRGEDLGSRANREEQPTPADRSLCAAREWWFGLAALDAGVVAFVALCSLKRHADERVVEEVRDFHLTLRFSGKPGAFAEMVVSAGACSGERLVIRRYQYAH